MKYAWIAAQRGSWPVRTMCQVLDVSSSGFYEWLRRPASCRTQEDARLTQCIQQSFERSGCSYGSPRVWHDLRAAGESCGHNRVARLMRLAGLQARQKRRRRGSTEQSFGTPAVAQNLLRRDFVAVRPNEKWVGDITYLWTAQGWLFLAAVMDLYSRRIIGWSMAESMEASLVVDALHMAVGRRGAPRHLLHHSDQGRQYGSEEFQNALRLQGITCSMSRRGNCWDNAVMESFFSSLKTERVSRSTYPSRRHARADVFEYIERFYNPRRRHSTLNFLSPVQFEEQSRAIASVRESG